MWSYLFLRHSVRFHLVSLFYWVCKALGRNWVVSSWSSYSLFVSSCSAPLFSCPPPIWPPLLCHPSHPLVWLFLWPICDLILLPFVSCTLVKCVSSIFSTWPHHLSWTSFISLFYLYKQSHILILFLFVSSLILSDFVTLLVLLKCRIQLDS